MEFFKMKMRKNMRMMMAATLLIMMGLASCTDDDSLPDITIEDQVENNMQKGTWSITKFVDSDKDETNNFAGYTFTFEKSGVLTASNGTNTYKGTWSITDSNSNDDSKDDLDFNINFNLTNAFEDLNDDWDILSQSSEKIELMDVSGGNGGTDYLTFQKN